MQFRDAINVIPGTQVDNYDGNMHGTKQTGYINKVYNSLFTAG